MTQPLFGRKTAGNGFIRAAGCAALLCVGAAQAAEPAAPVVALSSRVEAAADHSRLVFELKAPGSEW
jgi:hypothetical protein